MDLMVLLHFRDNNHGEFLTLLRNATRRASKRFGKVFSRPGLPKFRMIHGLLSLISHRCIATNGI